MSTEKRAGPAVSVTRDCNGCKYVRAESYAVQGDSGHEVYCTHPSVEKKFIGDTTWKTPPWCPVAPEREGSQRTLVRDAVAAEILHRMVGHDERAWTEQARKDAISAADYAVERLQPESALGLLRAAVKACPCMGTGMMVVLVDIEGHHGSVKRAAICGAEWCVGARELIARLDR